MGAALWRDVRHGSHDLSRRLRKVGLEIAWAGTDQRMTVRKTAAVARLSGPPGELQLYLFGRQAAARVGVTGPAEATATVRHARFGT
jgi:hypothetical protein